MDTAKLWGFWRSEFSESPLFLFGYALFMRLLPTRFITVPIAIPAAEQRIPGSMQPKSGIWNYIPIYIIFFCAIQSGKTKKQDKCLKSALFYGILY